MPLPELEPGSPVHSASNYMFKHEVKDNKELKELIGINPSQTEWCAAFVNTMLHQNDIPGSESVSDYPLMARSFLTWGNKVKEPAVGDIVVFARGDDGWQGHVSFYIRTSNDGKYYYVLGGNQSDMVNVEAYPVRKVLSIRRWSR